MNPKILLAGAALAAIASACTWTPSDSSNIASNSAQASGAGARADSLRGGTTPVTTGVAVRGLTTPPPKGDSGTSTSGTCDFSGEEVDQYGRMIGASVQCLAGGTLPKLLKNLPKRFNSYCAVDAGHLKGRLISAPIDGNKQHCDLSAMTPAKAESAFGGAEWR